MHVVCRTCTILFSSLSIADKFNSFSFTWYSRQVQFLLLQLVRRTSTMPSPVHGLTDQYNSFSCPWFDGPLQFFPLYLIWRTRSISSHVLNWYIRRLVWFPFLRCKTVYIMAFKLSQHQAQALFVSPHRSCLPPFLELFHPF